MNTAEQLRQNSIPPSANPLLGASMRSSFFSYIESLRDLFSVLGRDGQSIERIITALPDEETRKSLLKILTLSSELRQLAPHAEQAALSLISSSQRANLKEQSLRDPPNIAEKHREAEAISLDRVVVVPKLSKIEYRMRQENLSFDEVLVKLNGEQEDVNALVGSHHELARVTKEFLRYFRADQIVDRDDLSPEKLLNASAVIALGGDDHLAYVTQSVLGQTPVIGMKADPMSIGVILNCSATDLESVVSKIESADYKFEPWLRLKVSVDGQHMPPTLGTVLLGDKFSEYLSRNRVQIEDAEGNRLFGTEGRGLEQRSSGVLLYSGTGSTGYAKGAARYIFPESKTFPRTSRYIEMVLSVPSDSVPFADGTHGLPKIMHAVIHEGEKIIITSLNKDGGIVSLDSVFRVPFLRGSKATIEIDPEPLWMIVPSSEGGYQREVETLKKQSRPTWLDCEWADPRKGEVSRIRSPRDYPTRQVLAGDKLSWTVEGAAYNPEFYEHPKLETAVWAEPANISKEEFQQRREKGELLSYVSELRFDPKSGRPLNPIGRTGIAGRGVLGKHGANFAVDPIVIYHDSEDQSLYLLVIKRRSGAWALPGGMVDKGEDNTDAMFRELFEETNIPRISVERNRVKGWGETVYSDDPRSTDNAWIETTPSLILLDKKSAKNLPIKAGDDAMDVKWMEINEESLRSLYASHAFVVVEALKHVFQGGGR